MSVKATLAVLCCMATLSGCGDKYTAAEDMPPVPAEEKEVCIRSFDPGYMSSIQRLGPNYVLFSFKAKDEKQVGYTPICSSEAANMIKAAGYVPATLEESQEYLRTSKEGIPFNTVILGTRIADENGTNFPVYRRGFELHDVNTTWLENMTFLAQSVTLNPSSSRSFDLVGRFCF